jgi:hypothetical protein
MRPQRIAIYPVGDHMAESEKNFFDKGKDLLSGGKAAFDWLRNRLGTFLAVVIVLLLGGGSISVTVWWNWKEIKERPYVDSIVAYFENVHLINRDTPLSASKTHEEKEFSMLGPTVAFGCAEGNTSGITFNAPSGYRILTVYVEARDTENAKYNTTHITFNPSLTPYKAIASVYFQGRDREPIASLPFPFQGKGRELSNCPGGGHGRARIYGTMIEE